MRKMEEGKTKKEQKGEDEPVPPPNMEMHASGKKAQTKDLMVPLALLGTIVAAIIFFGFLGSEMSTEGMRDWIDSFGPWGPVIFLLVYIAAIVLAFPASIPTVLAGVLFGAVLGVILVSIASTTGAAIAFLVARYIARDATVRALANKPAFKRLEMLTQDHGPMVVALVRLVPLFPFNLVNYGFGLTKIQFKTYVFWSWLCMLPFTIVLVVGGDIVMSFSEGKVPWVLILVLAIVAVILTTVVKQAKELLGEKEQECLNRRGITCVEDIIHDERKAGTK